MILYEVNLEVDEAVAAAFADWLHKHVDEMLNLPGFVRADIFEVAAQGPTRCWSVAYRLASQQALDNYLEQHAPQMRAQGADRFGDQMRATRRILSPARPEDPSAVNWRIRDIDHVVLRVVDLDSMLDFYQRVLGCAMEKVQADIGLYQLRAGSSLIDLVTVEGELGRAGGAAPGSEGHNLDHFCLRVAPFDGPAIVRQLKQLGVATDGVSSRYGADGQGPSIYITDPEGNTVELKGPPWAPADVDT